MNNLADTEHDRKPAKGALGSAFYLVRTLGCKVIPVHSVRDDGSCTCSLGARCKSKGKHPACSGGWKDGTDEEDKIHAMFAKNHPLNIGVVADSLAILDVDKPGDGHGEGSDGYETLNRLEEEHGKLPATVTVRTGAGGEHRYYRLPPGAKVRKKRLGPGLELLGDGCYVIGPGSRHACGGVYGWVDGLSPEDVPLAPVPEWLVALAMGQVVQDRRSLENILDEMGPLSSDASADDVERFRTRVAEAVCSGRLGGRSELLRTAAVGQLRQVKWITNPATVMTEAVYRRSVELRRVGEQVEEAEEEPEPVPPELLEKARTLLENPGLLDIAATTMTRLGLRGEEINRRVDLPPGTVPLLMLVQPPFSSYLEAQAKTAS